MTAPVALVLVSHSRGLAAGVAELAAQMAPDVLLLPAGGMDDGGLGTSSDLIESAVQQATDDERSAVVLTDLGSAVLTTESVLELLDDDVAARVVLVDAPFVEGAVAAAVRAQGGASLEQVAATAREAGSTFGGGAPAPSVEAPAPRSGAEPVRASVVLRNPLGLHARPAAVLARAMAQFDARVLLDGVDAASILSIMQLAATGGRTLSVEATGPQAAAAVDALVELVEDGFGEV